MTDHSNTTPPAPSAPTTPTARPRPQFGELATPEEQRAAIAVPLDVAASESVPVVEADATAREKADGKAAAKAAAKADRDAEPTLADQKESSTGTAVRAPSDRFASWALLGLGLFNILTTSSALIDLPAAITQFFAADDLDPYGPVGTARVLGIAALVVSVGLWILTLVLVQRRVNAGRISWWIPLVTGLISIIVVLVCVGGAMMIDPAVFQYIQQMSGAAS
ncbi:DUF6264 family protein [Labedella endophytica]|jgi:hypothetical protein|uniref:Uncharacterized protein n=1 Tax=Labedella endophytica TaxID=1523160 RepID=A0A433JQE3_9MICO|nr:DUF6264 family protein [Labedella endophytica]RUQ99205.1 hypothetical protein ELQ94_12935 [Labedella endophytica]